MKIMSAGKIVKGNLTQAQRARRAYEKIKKETFRNKQSAKTLEKKFYNKKIPALQKLQIMFLKTNLAQINWKVRNFLRKQKIDLNNAVFVGIDRGGRIPSLALKKALDLDSMQFVKLSFQELTGRKFERVDKKLLNLAKKGNWNGKSVIFVDSTVKTGHQKALLRFFFHKYSEKIGIKKWKLIGKGRNADLNLEWGFPLDEKTNWYFFENQPFYIGVGEKDKKLSRFPQTKISGDAKRIRGFF